MFSAMLLAISIVALSQFALYYWRAVLAGVAALPVSDRVLVAAQVENGQLTPEDFQTLAGLHDLTPDLYPNRSGLAWCELTTVLSKVLTPFSARFPPSLSGASANASSAPVTPLFRLTAGCRPISTSQLLCVPASLIANLTE